MYPDCDPNYRPIPQSAFTFDKQPKELIEMNIKERLASLMDRIDKALVSGNETIFNKLSKQYKYLSMEM